MEQVKITFFQLLEVQGGGDSDHKWSEYHVWDTSPPTTAVSLEKRVTFVFADDFGDFFSGVL